MTDPVAASIELRAIRADYQALLTNAERLADDHSPGAVFRRAWHSSMSDAPRSRTWKARALQLDPTPLHNAIALAGMAPMRWEDRWHLAIALPQPSPAAFALDDVEDIVLIDPKSGQAFIVGDAGATHLAPRAAADRITVHTDAKAWAREIALHRLEWYRLRQQRRIALQAEPTWTGGPPSALLLAKPSKVRWSDLQADILDVPAHVRADVRRAMFAQARLPRVEGRA